MNRYRKEEKKRGRSFPAGESMSEEEWKKMLDKYEPLGGIPSDEYMEIKRKLESNRQKDGEPQKGP
jgi:hypothetical protein